ncbi:Serine/threonine-protein kinase WNK3 (Protein kinase lysine-deficient 3) (Protein kinase with no lysine 3) [Durusdinium trenchii]|uniref:Serine/threonine-protein kinase WNK3 (Protein kinase lysine-deficient 3) (Protein kinase with no lysine 3) n=1 Tax=Durusdinium trenchii TaxID=1381693 RepID=A0ABP0IW13_9DINO
MDPSCDEKIASIRKETEVLMKIQGHPNICQCLGCFDAFRPGTSQAQYIMIVMELIQGGELASFIRNGQGLDEQIVKSVMKQTTEGIKFIHDRDVVHRDLKVENILVCGADITPTTPVKVIDFGVAKPLTGTIARSCVGTTEIMAPELVSAKLMIAPKGASMKKHGPYSFKSPQDRAQSYVDTISYEFEASPGFGIVTQRPDGKGAMVNGIEPGGQAAHFGIGDGWAISHINNTEVLEMPFVKDFNEIGAGTKRGVTAIAEILGSLDAPFTMDFVELPKREFSKALDLWSLGVSLYVMLTGKKPFEEETQIVNGDYDRALLKQCSPEAQDLVGRLLRMEPGERLTPEQVLAHPFLR